MDLALPIAGSWGDRSSLALLATIAVPVCIVDLRHRRIPDVLVLPALAIVVLVRMVWGSGGWGGAPLWACGTGLMLLVPALLRPDGMGLGDVKLAALLGACLGGLAPLAVLLALVAGAVGGAAHAWMRGVRVRDATIPFGPFLLGAALAVALPVVFVHSPHAFGHPNDPSGARAALRPACLRLGRIGRHQALGRARASHRARHAGGACARGGGAAP